MNAPPIQPPGCSTDSVQFLGDSTDAISRQVSMGSSTAESTEVKLEQEDNGRSKVKTIVLMVALCLSIFLAALDTVIITTALPTIATIFEISDSGYAWIGSAYLLTNAAFVPFWGKISDIFGRKPILIIANVIFMIGSVISARSGSMTMLIAGRAVQGLGGGGIVILVNICVSDLFSLRYDISWIAVPIFSPLTLIDHAV
jgi:MFS family permease